MISLSPFVSIVQDQLQENEAHLLRFGLKFVFIDSCIDLQVSSPVACTVLPLPFHILYQFQHGGHSMGVRTQLPCCPPYSSCNTVQVALEFTRWSTLFAYYS